MRSGAPAVTPGGSAQAGNARPRFLHCHIAALPNCHIEMTIKGLKIVLGNSPFLLYLTTTLVLPISSETDPNLPFSFPVNAWTQILSLVNI